MFWLPSRPKRELMKKFLVTTWLMKSGDEECLRNPVFVTRGDRRFFSNHEVGRIDYLKNAEQVFSDHVHRTSGDTLTRG
jgi:hypothetical protein